MCSTRWRSCSPWLRGTSGPEVGGLRFRKEARSALLRCCCWCRPFLLAPARAALSSPDRPTPCLFSCCCCCCSSCSSCCCCCCCCCSCCCSSPSSFSSRSEGPFKVEREVRNSVHNEPMRSARMYHGALERHSGSARRRRRRLAVRVCAERGEPHASGPAPASWRRRLARSAGRDSRGTVSGRQADRRIGLPRLPPFCLPSLLLFSSPPLPSVYPPWLNPAGVAPVGRRAGRAARPPTR